MLAGRRLPDRRAGRKEAARQAGRRRLPARHAGRQQAARQTCRKPVGNSARRLPPQGDAMIKAYAASPRRLPALPP